AVPVFRRSPVVGPGRTWPGCAVRLGLERRAAPKLDDAAARLFVCLGVARTWRTDSPLAGPHERRNAAVAAPPLQGQPTVSPLRKHDESSLSWPCGVLCERA